MKIAIFPGSFNPFHAGHKYIYNKASNLFDLVVIYVSINNNKKYQNSLKYRAKKIQKILPGAKVIFGNQLTVFVAKKIGSKFIVRGVRNTEDFLLEKKNSERNQELDKNIETVLLFTNKEYSKISSTKINSNLKNNSFLY